MTNSPDEKFPSLYYYAILVLYVCGCMCVRKRGPEESESVHDHKITIYYFGYADS